MMTSATFTSPQFRFKLATFQSLAFAGFAHFNYRMPNRAWSHLRAWLAA
jgi:hypothetical protein